jgi:hypothetical protein
VSSHGPRRFAAAGAEHGQESPAAARASPPAAGMGNRTPPRPWARWRGVTPGRLPQQQPPSSRWRAPSAAGCPAPPATLRGSPGVLLLRPAGIPPLPACPPGAVRARRHRISQAGALGDASIALQDAGGGGASGRHPATAANCDVSPIQPPRQQLHPGHGAPQGGAREAAFFFANFGRVASCSLAAAGHIIGT